MSRCQRALSVVLAVIATAARAQVPLCEPENQRLPDAGSAFVAPKDATAIQEFQTRPAAEPRSWTRLAGVVPPVGALDATLRDTLASNAPSADGLAAIWTIEAGAKKGRCLQVINAAITEPPAGGPPKEPNPNERTNGARAANPECPATGDPLANCQVCASTWKAKIDNEQGGHNYSLAVYTEAGDLCLLQSGTVGEPIFFGIYSELSTSWNALRFEPCSIEPDGPAIFVSAPGVTISGARQKGVFYLRKYPPRRCYNPTLNIRVTGEKGTTAISIDHPVQQAQRYRATFQLGVVFTKQHLHTFALQPSGGTTVIFDQGPTGTGVEYQASLVLYALPRNVIALFGRPYPGRDLVRDQGILDRIGGSLGVSLSDPSRRFYAGLAFEVLYGVNVTYGLEFFRGRELAGVSVGDPFAADAGPIPTREHWGTDGVWGVSVDLLYAKELFSGRIRP